MDLKRAVNGDQVTVGASSNPTLVYSFKKITRSKCNNFFFFFWGGFMILDAAIPVTFCTTV
jgi:hypothetical protein